MKIIDEGAIRTAVVVDDNNKLCGMVTDGNIRRGILRGVGIDEKISEVMNKNPVYAHVGTSREEILNIIKKNEDIFNIPLVDPAYKKPMLWTSEWSRYKYNFI